MHACRPFATINIATVNIATHTARMVSHYQPCLLVWCLTIGHAFWCGASLSAMVLIIGRDFWCGTSLSVMLDGVVPHYRTCMLACYLTIGHAFSSIATATDILLVECRWKKVGYNSVATLTEVRLHQTWLLILCHSQICLLVQPTLSDMHAGFIYSDTCNVLLHQARHLVSYKSTRHAYR